MPMIEEVGALLVQSQLHKAVLDNYQQQASALYVLEARYTLFHVHRLLQNKNNPWLEQTLENFLKTRWKRLKNTDAQYFHDTQNPANLMCIEIAKTLGRLQDKAYLLFLIPTLSMVPAFAYVASSYEDDDLEFNQLMLSDNATRMIHIPEVLEFSEQDGVLKHGALVNGGRCDLTIAEENRLLARHPSVDDYYHAVRDKINFQLHGESAGAYIARLIKGLRAGGSLGSGSETLTGHEANTAIVDFSNFLDSLTEETRNKIFEASKFERWLSDTPEYVSIGQSWAFLKDPLQASDGGEQEITYCVELIADGLEEILAENPTLYQLMSLDQEGVSTLTSFEEAVAQCKTTMLGALHTSEAHRYYGLEGDEKLALDVLSKVSRDRAFNLDYADIAYVARCFLGDNSALKASSELILLHTRDYMTSRSLRTALNDLPRQMAHDVEERVFPQFNRHIFFSDERSNERPPCSEPLSKKAKHVHFQI